MINENKTFQEKGYYTYDLKSKSQKKVCRVCDVCGRERWIRYSGRHDKCQSCVRKGIVFTKEHKHNLSKSHMGNLGYWTGKKRSKEVIEKLRHSHIGKKQSNETILKRIQCGKDHYNWQGGITPETRRRTRGIFWKKIADSIRERDNNICQRCGFIGNETKLPVHHIIPFNISQNNNEENLITLCQSCHMKVEKELQ